MSGAIGTLLFGLALIVQLFIIAELVKLRRDWQLANVAWLQEYRTDMRHWRAQETMEHDTILRLAASASAEANFTSNKIIELDAHIEFLKRKRTDGYANASSSTQSGDPLV